MSLEYNPEQETVNQFLRRIEAYQRALDERKYRTILSVFRTAIQQTKMDPPDSVAQIKFNLNKLNYRRVLYEPYSSPLVEAFYCNSVGIIRYFKKKRMRIRFDKLDDDKVLKIMGRLLRTIGFRLNMKPIEGYNGRPDTYVWVSQIRRS